jgi:hypothetical protein
MNGSHSPEEQYPSGPENAPNAYYEALRERGELVPLPDGVNIEEFLERPEYRSVTHVELPDGSVERVRFK